MDADNLQYVMRLHFPIIHAVDPRDNRRLLCGRSAVFPPVEPCNRQDALFCYECAEARRNINDGVRR